MAESSRSSTRVEDDFDDDQAQRERYAQRIRELRRVPEMMEHAYRDAWMRFYAWEPGYCEQLLQTLYSPSESFPTVTTLGDHSATLDPMDVPLSSNVFTFWSDDDNIPPISVLAEQIVLPVFDLRKFAYSKYEACTPSTHTIRTMDDPRILQFIPYADEPGFHSRQFAHDFNSFAWQTQWYDVDFRLIGLDAVWSLHNAGVSLSTMDKHLIPFFPLTSGDPGLMSALRRRDLFSWGDNSSSDQLAALRTTMNPRLWRSVCMLDYLFCSGVGCINANCMVHERSKPPLRPVKHVKQNKSILLDGATRPCGPKCYRLDSVGTSLENDIFVVNEDICDIIKLFPDETICKLATLCNTDCYSVFAHRILSLPDSHFPRSFFSQSDEQSVPFPGSCESDDICDHDGHCVVQSGCVCAQNNNTCSRRCRCEVRGCALRTGCQCDNCSFDDDPKRQIRRCPCYDGGWECSELCKSHKPKKKKSGNTTHKHICKNMQLQTDKKPNLEVKKGSYGLGTYTTKALKKHTYLGEYTAEMSAMLPAEEQERVDNAQRKVNQHRNLNYMFSLRTTPFMLDAATVGDPTRYLNDSRSNMNNVMAIPMMVDGDERIYFYTERSVAAGQELLLEYGSGYWEHHDDTSDEEGEDGDDNGAGDGGPKTRHTQEHEEAQDE